MTDPRDDPHSLYNRGAHVGPIGKAEYREVPDIDAIRRKAREAHQAVIDMAARGEAYDLTPRDIASLTDSELERVAAVDAQVAMFEARRREREKVLAEVEAALRKLPSMATAEQLVPTYPGVSVETFMAALRGKP